LLTDVAFATLRATRNAKPLDRPERECYVVPAPLVLQILESLNREVLNELDLAGSIAPSR
jgi:hypothetical protein